MEEFSYFLFWAGFISVIAAAVSYVAYAVSGRSRVLSGATPAGTVSISVPGERPEGLGRLATLMAWMAAGFLGSAVVTRGFAAGRPPYGNMWEYFQAFAFGISAFYVVFERRHGERILGAFVFPVTAVLLAISETFFPHQLETLVPALHNNRLLAIHVASMLTAYSVLATAFGASVLYLVQGEGHRFASLPDAETADEIAHKAIMVGFPLLGLGIALGAYWGNIAWGRYWGWDPKETTALITWLIYAVYMHARALAGWRGNRTAMLSILGFSAIVFNIFVVNFVIAGLHSYAGA